ncbi:MAG: thiamine phosphate synthase [Oscillospiraceae bacterium]|jgi:thiamine-phosphate pyrophosphorylase|nr:thiamine phosphate synthase [Oscillospiraceae bacterium]
MNNIAEMIVTNRRLCHGDFLMQLDRAAATQPYAILLREKDLAAAEYRALARQALPLCAAHGVPLIAHSFAAVAQGLGVPALHLPFAAFVAAAQVGQLGAFAQRGVSIHSPAEARQAEALGATYLLCGNIFATASKPGLPPRGLEYLHETCAAVQLPVFAIGGITEENAALCVQQGAAGVCRMGHWFG